ncbi:MAG TPA: hypothetical protein VGH22_10865 [Candidatus Binatia bacterium]|jgi:hypothetical protein
MMRKITVFTLCAMLFAFCSSARAQQPKKVTRIGYLSSQAPGYESARAEGIRLALRGSGYIEGQNIAIDYQVSVRHQLENRETNRPHDSSKRFSESRSNYPMIKQSKIQNRQAIPPNILARADRVIR